MTKIKGKLIKRLRLTEISIVDRPANPEALFTVQKFDSEGGETMSAIEELKKAAGEVIDALKSAVGKSDSETPDKPVEKSDTEPIDLTPVVEAVNKMSDGVTSAIDDVNKRVDEITVVPEGTEAMVKFVTDNHDVIEKMMQHADTIEKVADLIDDIEKIGDIMERVTNLEDVRGTRLSDPAEPVHKSTDSNSGWGDVLSGG